VVEFGLRLERSDERRELTATLAVSVRVGIWLVGWSSLMEEMELKGTCLCSTSISIVSISLHKSIRMWGEPIGNNSESQGLMADVTGSALALLLYYHDPT
jgi:hypothetical protein